LKREGERRNTGTDPEEIEGLRPPGVKKVASRRACKRGWGGVRGQGEKEEDS